MVTLQEKTRPIRIKLSLVFVALLCSIQSTWADKLIFAAEVVRHGERTASGDLPNFPYEDPRGQGNLTSAGIEQLIAAGADMRAIYHDKYSLIGDSYNPNEIYARSTDINRTLMSANAILIGLFDASKQPFAIHTVPQAQDDLLLSYLKHYYVLNNFWEQDPKLEELSESLQPKFARLSYALGTPVTTLDDFIGLVDTLYIRKQANQPVPPVLSNEEIDDLYLTMQKAAALMWHKREIGALVSTKFMDELKSYIDKAVAHDKKSAKFTLFTGHDVTLAGLMSALAGKIELYPPYAGRISIMLFEVEQSSNQYLVKFLYNNQEVKIPECANSTQCTLQEFDNLVATIKSMSRVITV